MVVSLFFFFQAEDGIRDLVRSRGLGDVYKRQEFRFYILLCQRAYTILLKELVHQHREDAAFLIIVCLLYTSDAADERSSVDLGGRRIIKKKKHNNTDH